MRKYGLVLGVLTLTLTQLFALAGPASANYGSTTCGGTPRNCVSLANNRYHAVRYNSLGTIPGIGAETTWALNNVYNPTDLVAYRDDADPLPDVIVSDADFGDNGLVGWVECPTDNTGTGGSHPLRWCRGQRLRYNAEYTATDFNTETKRRKVACHEMAHTVGLRHWDDYHSGQGSCTFSTPVDANTTGLAGHEITDHINPWY